MRPARTPPSTFLFLPIHLSNSPEPRGSTHQQAGGPPKPHASDRKSEAWSPNISEVLRRRVIAPERRTACQEGLYRLAAGPLSTDPRPKNRGLRLGPMQGPRWARTCRIAGRTRSGKLCGRWRHAVLRPHSSAVLCAWWEVSVRGFIRARVARVVARPAYPKSAEKIGLKTIGSRPIGGRAPVGNHVGPFGPQ